MSFAKLLTPVLWAAIAASGAAQTTPITIHTTRALDGRGGAIENADITIENGRITRIDRGRTAARATTTYDLSGLTLLPGLIDAHSHPTWYFNRAGRYHTGRGDDDTPVQSMLSTVGNAYATLL